jgi:capsular polysaccharide biosynthesis protein
MASDFPEEKLVHWTGEAGDAADVGEYSKLFANAKIVFACMGAGLTNTLFMDPGTVVIEVAACGRLLYIHQSNALGLRHYGYCHAKQWKTWHWVRLP